MLEFIQHIINGLSTGSIYALIALGYTMVFGVLQLINFAHSDVFMLGAFVSFYFSNYFPSSFFLAGEPIQVSLSGTFFVTTAPAPIKAYSPME